MGNAHFDECFEEEWCNHNKLEEETSDESLHNDSSPKEVQPQENEIINTEEKDTETDISVSLFCSVRKSHSQSAKRSVEKKIPNYPSKKKQYLGSTDKGLSSQAPMVPPTPQQPMASMGQVHSTLPSLSP